MTDQEKRLPRFYTRGQIVLFSRDDIGLGVAQDRVYRVAGIAKDGKGRQLVRLSDENDRTILWDPRLGRTSRVNIFNEEHRDLAKGDRIQWRLVDHALGIRNADRGTVEKLTGRTATILWDRDGRRQEIDLTRHKNWDHGYAETVYSAQSKTYDRVYVLAPVGSSLVTGKNYYTAITRARFGVKLWTERGAPDRKARTQFWHEDLCARRARSARQGQRQGQGSQTWATLGRAAVATAGGS
jgi:ATP-dependent exoDNAse (exonuclease V) alpha subunit